MDIYEIDQLSIAMWREHFYRPLQCGLFSAILQLIEKDRNGEMINSILLNKVRIFDSKI